MVKQVNLRVFHYTTWPALVGILDTMEIRTTAIGLVKGEKPAAWFSINPDWEETVRKAFRTESGEQPPLLSRDALLDRGVVPVRIEVNPNLPFLDWPHFKLMSGISQKLARGMETLAREWGANPDEWRALFSPVTIEDFRGFEAWTGVLWIDIIDAFGNLSEKKAALN